MDVFISHESALQYWRLHGKVEVKHGRQLRRKNAPAFPPKTSTLLQRNIRGLSFPLDVTVSDSNSRRQSQVIRFHVFSGLLSDGSFIKAGEGILMSSPEFCFLQMADKLSLIKLIQLGFELCGTYSLPVKDPDSTGQSNVGEVIYNRTPLSNVKKLSGFANQMPGVHGRKLALRALQYITDGSGSPMETILTMLLTLPYKLGGYGFRLPKLNSRIIPAKTIKRSSGKRYYSCDLFWPDADLAVEYDSDQHHTGAERIASDSKRRNTLSSAGILIITVTSQQIHDREEFEKVARLIAVNLDKPLRYRDPGFSTTQMALRDTLLAYWLSE